ncbi:MAG: L-lactate dehydrogenase, partial [Micrococcales bacterium]
MIETRHSKVTVVGAGAVGSSSAYAMLIRGSARDIVLYDIDTVKVAAEVLDLAHGTSFTGSSSIDGGSDIDLTADSDVIVVTAGAKQKPGQTRLELAGVNFSILESMLPKLLELSPNAIFVLVTNPCDVLATAAVKILGLPASRVFSSGTVLDSSRLRWLLGDRLKVSTASIHALIIGEHGDSEFPLWSQASIGPVPLSEWKTEDGHPLSLDELNSIHNLVKTAAYRVIEGKGATNYAIGLSAARIVEAVLSDEQAILPVSSVLSNYHGVSGLAMSVPTLVNAQGAARTVEISMD